MPGLIAVTVDRYGYSGAMLILAALILNIIPASLFYSGDKNVPASSTGSDSDNNNYRKNIYSNPRLWFCIFSMASTTVGYTNFGLYLPLHLHNTLGLSNTVAASFISVFAIGDLVGRLSGFNENNELFSTILL